MMQERGAVAKWMGSRWLGGKVLREISQIYWL